MATDFKTLQATANALIEAVVAKADSFQETYFQNNGRYAQCIQNPTAIPADGAKVATDTLVKPFYQDEDWRDFGFTLPDTSEVSIRIDTYDGPKGHDWCAVTTFIADGVLYTRSLAAKSVEAPTFDWTASKVPPVTKIDVASIDDPVVIDADPTPLQNP